MCVVHALLSDNLLNSSLQALEKVGLKWSMLATTSWDSMYETLVDYVTERTKDGSEWDGNVPANFRTADNPPRALGRWINRQRSAYVKDKLKPDAIEKLSKLGLKWSVHERRPMAEILAGYEGAPGTMEISGSGAAGSSVPDAVNSSSTPVVNNGTPAPPTARSAEAKGAGGSPSDASTSSTVSVSNVTKRLDAAADDSIAAKPVVPAGPAPTSTQAVNVEDKVKTEDTASAPCEEKTTPVNGSVSLQTTQASAQAAILPAPTKPGDTAEPAPQDKNSSQPAANEPSQEASKLETIKEGLAAGEEAGAKGTESTTVSNSSEVPPPAAAPVAPVLESTKVNSDTPEIDNPAKKDENSEIPPETQVEAPASGVEEVGNGNEEPAQKDTKLSPAAEESIATEEDTTTENKAEQQTGENKETNDAPVKAEHPESPSSKRKARANSSVSLTSPRRSSRSK